MTKDECLSDHDEIEDIEKEKINNNFIIENKKNNNISIIFNDDKEIIIIKGNTIKYNKRIFIYDKNANKYKAKKNRKIYHCLYH